MGVAKEKVYHKMILEGEKVNLTQSFDNLYIESYKQILAQGGLVWMTLWRLSNWLMN